MAATGRRGAVPTELELKYKIVYKRKEKGAVKGQSQAKRIANLLQQWIWVIVSKTGVELNRR